MVKAKLYRLNHTKKHTDTHSQKVKRKKIYISFGKSEVFCQRSVGFVGVVPHVDVFLMYLWGGR